MSETFLNVELPMMLIKLAIMTLVGGAFPLLFAMLWKKTITKKAYVIACCVVNTLFLCIIGGGFVGCFTGLGIGGKLGIQIMKKRGILVAPKKAEPTPASENQPTSEYNPVPQYRPASEPEMVPVPLEETERKSLKTELTIGIGVALLVLTVLVAVLIKMAGQSRDFTYGYLTGDTYVNTYTGYGCKLNKGWTIEVAEAGKEAEFVVDSDGDAVYAMKATNTGNGATIGLGYEKLNFYERVRMLYQSNEAQLALELSGMRNEYESAFLEQGAKEVSVEQETVTFLGEECEAIKTVVTVYNVSLYMVQLMDFKLGEYCTVLTCMSIGTDTTQNLLDLFYAVE